MNKCTDSDAREMLPDLLHRTLADDTRARVEAHVERCGSCREDLEVLRTVKNAAVFAPAIDVNRIVRQIPPYRRIVPAVETPARARVATWLVAATVAILVVGGGGSALLSRQKAAGTRAAVAGASQTPPLAVETPPTPSKTPLAVTRDIASPSTPSHTPALALAADVENLSDGKLVQLMNDMNRFDALPNSEADPVIISVDSGDSL